MQDGVFFFVLDTLYIEYIDILNVFIHLKSRCINNRKNVHNLTLGTRAIKEEFSSFLL